MLKKRDIYANHFRPFRTNAYRGNSFNQFRNNSLQRNYRGDYNTPNFTLDQIKDIITITNFRIFQQITKAALREITIQGLLLGL